MPQFTRFWKTTKYWVRYQISRGHRSLVHRSSVSDTVGRPRPYSPESDPLIVIPFRGFSNDANLLHDVSFDNEGSSVPSRLFNRRWRHINFGRSGGNWFWPFFQSTGPIPLIPMQFSRKIYLQEIAINESTSPKTIIFGRKSSIPARIKNFIPYAWLKFRHFVPKTSTKIGLFNQNGHQIVQKLFDFY